MTPALASQCRRATQRHLCSHINATWLPEALTAIFERYYVISRIYARYGSSVPGPMENRRRMGKRQMGELSFGQSHSASPLWALENLADLTQWKWESPLPSDALHRRGRDEGGSLVPAMWNWVAGHTGSAPDIALDDAGDHLTHTPDLAEQPLPKIVWDAQTSPLVVIETGLDLLFRDLSYSTTRTTPNFTEFCHIWRESLANGLFSGETVCSVIDGIQDGLAILQSDTVKSLERKIGDQIILRLLTTTSVGLSSSGTHRPDYFDCSVWNDIMQRISKLQMNTLRAFTGSMANIPDHHLGDMSTSILANLNAYLLASGRERKRSSLIRQANKMANPLSRLNLANHSQILESSTRLVLDYMASEGLDHSQIRYGWLQLLARLPRVDFSYLAEVCCTLETGKDIEPLSNREICEMYQARHRSSIIDAPTVSNMLAEDIQGYDDSRFYGLFNLALWRTGQFHHVRGLCKFLEKLGREQDIMRLARGFQNLVKNEASSLAKICIGGRQPLLALEIIGLYEKSRTVSKNFWNSKFSTEALKLMTECPSLRQIGVLSALGLKYLRSKRRRRYELLTKRQILKATKAARAFAVSPIISRRISLTLITRCINYLQRSPSAVIPTSVLRALFHIVTRDLADGGLGRITRIRWVLALLDKQVGRDRMIRIGLGLKKWRELNSRRRRRKIR
ncbi:hypothetical protein F4781DRAFT_432054 [Annulohypoxylon bovei var. microspora]|nr:hypothetical protein F4781DRAFT_432054 [Annulohypoxylon bovei var. microspora]